MSVCDYSGTESGQIWPFGLVACYQPHLHCGWGTARFASPDFRELKDWLLGWYVCRALQPVEDSSKLVAIQDSSRPCQAMDNNNRGSRGNNPHHNSLPSNHHLVAMDSPPSSHSSWCRAMASSSNKEDPPVVMDRLRCLLSSNSSSLAVLVDMASNQVEIIEQALTLKQYN